ncbi:MAG: tetrahydrofolate dehydrogenase/cyclohydrolase catalytic domain-containing protein [Minisyncoccia bacterium]
MKINGKKIAAELLENLKNKINLLEKNKFFGAVIVGQNKESLNFLKQKQQIAEKLKIDFRIYNLEENITTDQLRKEIHRLSTPKTCGGFIVQLPLPAHINTNYVLNVIPKQKDVDLLSEHSLGAFYTGRSKILPPAVLTIKEILNRQKIETLNLKVAVIGFGSLVGKPIAFWLLDKTKEIRVFTSKDKDLESELKNYDLIVSGVGKAGLFSAKHLKNNAVVIDFGYDFNENNKIFGDFNPDQAEEKNIIYTPTPGGTGPILVLKLFENFYNLNLEKDKL